MKRSRIPRLTLALTLVVASAAAVGAPPAASGAAARSPAVLTPAERGEAARQFVLRWAPHVASTYGVDMKTWALRMAPVFAHADPDNLRTALSRDSYEAASLALDGRVMSVPGRQLAQQLKSTPTTRAGMQAAAPTLLGALSNDLVYTPVTPCRIVDTRSTAAGAIAANSARSFVGVNASNFSGQGGSSTNCGTLGLNATAIALNVTAVSPAAAGYATVYPYGTTQPLAASVNYAAGDIVNNAIIAQIPNPLSSFDFTVYTFAQAHYVVDIVGYFAPPLATALQCQDTANTIVSNIAAGGTANATAPACASGYTQTATNCETSSWLMPIVFSHAGTCSARNNDTTPQDLRASRTCCRVPGR